MGPPYLWNGWNNGKWKNIFCGGGTLPSPCDIDEQFSTSKCQSFDLMDLTLTTLDITMTEKRTFAQSMLFDNNTWFIMGGEDSQGFISDTTEYLDVNGTDFAHGFKMPEQSSCHCGKNINGSHLFTSGGYKRSSLEQPFVSLSRGQKKIMPICSFLPLWPKMLNFINQDLFFKYLELK